MWINFAKVGAYSMLYLRDRASFWHAEAQKRVCKKKWKWGKHEWEDTSLCIDRWTDTKQKSGPWYGISQWTVCFCISVSVLFLFMIWVTYPMSMGCNVDGRGEVGDSHGLKAEAKRLWRSGRGGNQKWDDLWNEMLLIILMRLEDMSRMSDMCES